jgi:SAM-dependent MidA family methyltransferase
MAAALTKGYALSVDYGFTRAESVRFPAGTLMGYRRHTARDDVLADAGLRDITAHVNFTALEESGAACGFATVRFETLARTLLAAGEADQFAAALGAGGAEEELRRRMQLKTLLFGMGETFRALLQKKTEGGDGGEKRSKKS